MYYNELKRTITDINEYNRVLAIKNDRGCYFRTPNCKTKQCYIDYDSLALNKNNNCNKPNGMADISYDDL